MSSPMNHFDYDALEVTFYPENGQFEAVIDVPGAEARALARGDMGWIGAVKGTGRTFKAAVAAARRELDRVMRAESQGV